MTEPLAKSEQTETIEKQMEAVSKKDERMDIVGSQVGTIVYKLNIENETHVETRTLKRRDFNWDSGKVEGRKKEFKQSQLDNTSLSLASRVVTLIREMGQTLYIPFSVYSALLFFWIKLFTYGVNRQNMKRHNHTFCMRSSIYMAVTCYGLSHSTMAVLSLTSYSTIMIQ